MAKKKFNDDLIEAWKGNRKWFRVLRDQVIRYGWIEGNIKVAGQLRRVRYVHGIWNIVD